MSGTQQQPAKKSNSNRQSQYWMKIAHRVHTICQIDTSIQLILCNQKLNEHSCYCHGLTVKNNNQSLLFDWLHLGFFSYPCILFLWFYARIHFFRLYFCIQIFFRHLLLWLTILCCFCSSVSIYFSSSARWCVFFFFFVNIFHLDFIPPDNGSFFDLYTDNDNIFGLLHCFA